jgi:hypothetical protein
MIPTGNIEIKRDADGMWMHPAFPRNELPEECDITPYVKEWGYEARFQSLDMDAPEAVIERYANSNEMDCSYWVPVAPAGEGWILGAIYDTWDCPVAMWIRPLLTTENAENTKTNHESNLISRKC